MEHLFIQHIQEIAQISQGILYCNEMICAKSTKEWERKEYQKVKANKMKRKITLIKILKNWN